MWTSLTSSQLYSIHLYPLSCFCQSLMLKYKALSPTSSALLQTSILKVVPSIWCTLNLNGVPVFPTAIALAYKHVAHLCHSATDELQLFTLKQMLLKDKNVTTIFAFRECLVKCLFYSALSAH